MSRASETITRKARTITASITRRLVWLVVCALPAIWWAVAMRAQVSDGQVPDRHVSDRARALHQSALVFDAHVHVVDRQFYHGGDMGQRVEDGQFDLVRAKEGGLDAMFFSLFVTEQYYPARLETKQVLRLIDAAYEQLERNKDKIELALNASDVERISATGKIAAFMDLEGGIAWDCGRSSCPLTTGRTISPTRAVRRPNGTD
jgi:membrane dipeptidase